MTRWARFREALNHAFAIREPPEPDPEWLRAWAAWLQKRRLSAPAIVLMELLQPFSWVLFNFAVGLGPFGRLLVGGEGWRHLEQFLEYREYMRKLQQILEEENHEK